MSYTLRQNINYALQSMGIDSLFIIEESFLGYKYRKEKKMLYELDHDLPTKLISLYYGLNTDRIAFNTLKKAFITHYINQESKLEGINVTNKHSKLEVQGLGKMYEYIHSDSINYMFDVYTLKDLHKQLYSLTAYPEFGGEFRNSPAHLKNCSTNLCDWWDIRPRLNELDKEVQELIALAPKVKTFDNIDLLFTYLDKCVELQWKLILVHPFSDGNGRTVRGFTNKLFEDAGLPPVYIKEKEKEEYLLALKKADDGNMDSLKNFYRYKICDSIVELDINQRIKEDREQVKEKTIGTLN